MDKPIITVSAQVYESGRIALVKTDADGEDVEILERRAVTPAMEVLRQWLMSVKS